VLSLLLWLRITSLLSQCKDKALLKPGHLLGNSWAGFDQILLGNLWAWLEITGVIYSPALKILLFG
jgi:hypothetical protein